MKIDPKSIGVGQYQHDVDQKKLKRSLAAIVESSVNRVGVDLNNASIDLLKYVSGIGDALAQNVVPGLTTPENLKNAQQSISMFQEVLAKEPNDTTFQKTLAINDFYLGGPGYDWPLGNIQMIGKSNAEAMRGEEPKLTKLAPHFSLAPSGEPQSSSRLTLTAY